MDIHQQKVELRSQLRTLRSIISHEEQQRKSHEICQWLIADLEAMLEADAEKPTIAVFYPMKDEVDLGEYVRFALKQGCTVAYPCMNLKGAPGLTMHMRSVSAHSLEDAPFIKNPLVRIDPPDDRLAEYPLVEPWQIDYLVVPLVGFDPQGGRLGYGGGNYDRYLEAIGPRCRVVGVAFSQQMVEQVPAEEHDLPLPQIIWA